VVELALTPACTLAQACEQPNRHSHPAKAMSDDAVA
jgi:hypothetical protein